MLLIIKIKYFYILIFYLLLSAQYPSGSFRLGPDSTISVIDISYRHFSGYNYQDPIIMAFSHTHLVGAGVNDLGHFGVTPFRKTEKNSPAYDEGPWESLNIDKTIKSRLWWSEYNKSTEYARPGLYGVNLKDPDVDVELLAISTMAGIHSYTWKELSPTDLAGLVIDYCHTSKIQANIHDDRPCRDAMLSISEDKISFTAAVQIQGGLSGLLWAYLYAEIVLPTSKRHLSWRTCTDMHLKSSCTKDGQVQSTTGTLLSFLEFSIIGQQAGPSLDFAIELHTGISYISIDLAKQNLKDAENGVSTYDGFLRRTTSVWCDTLSLLSLTPLPGDEEITRMLYSALYHTWMSPTSYTESGGFYMGLDKQVHNSVSDRVNAYGDKTSENPQSYNFYSDLSLWDTFRSQHPWLLFINEDLAVGIARSTADITTQQGAFPRWTLGSHEASCMVGLSGSALVLEAIGSGLGSQFDVKTIQQALLKQSTQPVPINGRSDVERYVSEGFVSMEASDVAASLTVTFAYDDFILSGISKYVGDINTTQSALIRSKNYRNVWSHDRGFICPKSSDGTLHCAKSPIGPEAWKSFVEGDALHWSWFVPHDPAGLQVLMGGVDKYDEALTSFFQNHVQYHEKFGSAVPNPYFWAGNEHSFFNVWMFSFGKNCSQTQYWSRQITQMHFSATPHGIPGNDDYGSMSSYILFTSLGLFPQAGTTQFVIGSPRVQSARVRLRRFNGQTPTLTIKTYNNSPHNVFVQRLLVNGVEHNSPFIDRSVLVDESGATLEFYMQATPNSGLCQ